MENSDRTEEDYGGTVNHFVEAVGYYDGKVGY